MATQLQLRKGNTAQTAVFTGALAEVTVDTDQDTVVVHDGTTVGGNYIVTKAQLQSNVSILQGINTTQNTNITAVNGFAQSAFNTANGANGLAAGAFAAANNKVASITGTSNQVVVTGTTTPTLSLPQSPN
jgi:ribosomal protein L24